MIKTKQKDENKKSLTIQFSYYLNFGCITFALLTFMRLILKIIIEMDLLPQNKLEAFVSHKCSFFYSSFRPIMENVAKLKVLRKKYLSKDLFCDGGGNEQ